MKIKTNGNIFIIHLVFFVCFQCWLYSDDIRDLFGDIVSDKVNGNFKVFPFASYNLEEYIFLLPHFYGFFYIAIEANIFPRFLYF